MKQRVQGTKIDETSNAHHGGYPASADDRSGGMRRQSNPISSTKRFSDCFGNSHEGNGDGDAHSDADYLDNSTAYHTHAYVRTV